MTVELPERPITDDQRYLATIAGEDGVELPPFPVTDDQRYLAKIVENGDGGGGGGTTNYNQLSNKPQINSVTLQGNKSSADLGLAGLEGNTFTQTQKVNSAAYAGMKLQDGSDPTTVFTDFGKTGMYISDGDGVKTVAYKSLATASDLAGKQDTISAGDGITVANSTVSAKIQDNVTSTAATESLSAKQGKLLNDRLNNVEALGRYLSVWDCTTGQPTTQPTSTPYSYRTGDYYIVGTVGTTNYKPNGSSYTGAASTTVETGTVEQGMYYLYDGTNWTLMGGASGGTGVQDVEISGTSIVSGGVATIPAFTDTAGSTAGTAGLVPAPATTDAGKFLKADGTWDDAGGGSGPTVVQTIGASTTDVMSQDAVTKMVYPVSNGSKVVITNNPTQPTVGTWSILVGSRNSTNVYPSAPGRYSIAIGAGANARYDGSIAIGDSTSAHTFTTVIGQDARGSNHQYSEFLGNLAGYNATSREGQILALKHISCIGYRGGGFIRQDGMVDISCENGNGYDGSGKPGTRVLTGLHDGVQSNDAATVAQGNTLATSAPTTSTVGVLGQLYTDTTNMHTYQCTAIDTSVTPNTYTWTQRW